MHCDFLTFRIVAKKRELPPFSMKTWLKKYIKIVNKIENFETIIKKKYENVSVSTGKDYILFWKNKSLMIFFLSLKFISQICLYIRLFFFSYRLWFLNKRLKSFKICIYLFLFINILTTWFKWWVNKLNYKFTAFNSVGKFKVNN